MTYIRVEPPRTAYVIPGRVGYRGGSRRRVRRFRFRFRRFRSRRVGRGRPVFSTT